MLFNSLHFAAFFVVVTLMYFALPHRARWALLLAASCYFYMAFIPKYILILFFLIGVDYVAALFIEKARGRKRKAWLIASLIANVGVLGAFKYFSFFTGHRLGWILPIGLSFHTFQSMAYTIEVYYGRYKAERHLGIYALYVLFYPQLVAGPIERPQHLLPQFRRKVTFDPKRVTEGLRLMLWGFFKKIAIADNMAVITDAVYGHPSSYSGSALIFATYCFTFQILCDFSGYSDIAIGAAKIMGIDLCANFERPYSAKSIAEFWRRWHISLSSWFRDYLYIPLGGKRVGESRHVFNLMFVFLVSGLWHGANWTFVIWGGLHGFYLVCSRFLKIKLPDLARNLITFHLVAFAWIFFRASSVTDAWYIVTHLFSGQGTRALEIPTMGLKTAIVLAAPVVVLELVHRHFNATDLRGLATKLSSRGRWALYYGLTLWILLLGNFGSREFIYFQF